MKEQRIVEWEEKPDYFHLIHSLIMIFLSFYTNLRINNVWGSFLLGVGFVLFMLIFYISLGKGKEVYWRRMK